jgi:spermidine/putrescine transport system ATP-binding protein
MQLELKRIQVEVGTTFVYVTHDQDEAMTMSDRLGVMRHGRIEQIGPPEETYERPATEFVAGFLGASNLLAGEVTGQRDGVAEVAVSGGPTVRLPVERLAGGVAMGDRVKVGVRPEKIVLDLGGGEAQPARNAVEGTVRDVTFVGVSHQYRVEGPGGALITVYAQNLGAGGAPSAGDRVRLSWEPAHTFVVRPSEEPIDEEEEVGS